MVVGLKGRKNSIFGRKNSMMVEKIQHICRINYTFSRKKGRKVKKIHQIKQNQVTLTFERSKIFNIWSTKFNDGRRKSIFCHIFTY